jgi:tetratricopeptide (TPR) repeat protein
MLLGRPADALTNLSAAIALDPGSAQLLRRRALAYKQAGQPALAARDLTAAIALSGGAYPDAERTLNAVHNDAAIADVAAGRLGDALEHLSVAIAHEPSVARFRANRAEVAHRLGDTELALGDYAAARALAERAADDGLEAEMRAKMSVLHYEAGTLLFNRAEYAAAYAALSRAVQANPRVPAYLLARAEVATMLKQWAVVRADAEAALAIDPSDGRAREMLSRVVPAA